MTDPCRYLLSYFCLFVPFLFWFCSFFYSLQSAFLLCLQSEGISIPCACSERCLLKYLINCIVREKWSFRQKKLENYLSFRSPEISKSNLSTTDSYNALKRLRVYFKIVTFEIIHLLYT